ncbi:hypothetical protein WUBG_00859 [Wuchereria bancrofti]|uniref:Uncharacterized protein n=1 Tax=Wuchereria bancrofti TaxID=6293 RepID=J9F043_WUCBA|nr:hypothetical protein WUBG_00859 [Wuchereria bancrofti]
MAMSRQGVSIWGPLRFPPSRTSPLPLAFAIIHVLKEGDRSELLEGPINDPSTSRFSISALRCLKRTVYVKLTEDVSGGGNARALSSSSTGWNVEVERCGKSLGR